MKIHFCDLYYKFPKSAENIARYYTHKTHCSKCVDLRNFVLLLMCLSSSTILVKTAIFHGLFIENV